MTRKLVPAPKKWDAVIRILEGRDDTANAARRLGVTQKAVQAWRREYFEAHPEAKSMVKPPAPPPPPPSLVEKPEPPKPAPEPYKDFRPEEPHVAGDPAKPGLIDAAAVKRAMEADGAAGAQKIVGKVPEQVRDLSQSSELEDLAICEGAGNQIMGLAARGMIFIFERKAGVQIEVTPRIQQLFVLTETEKAMLKPASRHLAAKIRELIGSDEKVAYGVGGSTVVQGLWDRGRIIGEAVARAIEEKAAKAKEGNPKK